MPMSPDEDREFTEFLRSKAAEAERLIRYRPTLFLQMLASNGGYQTAVQLLSSRAISEGFTKLWRGKHLELTVEALVLESRWRSHFDPVLQDIAAKRLRDVGYEAKVARAEPPSAPSPALSISVQIEWEDTFEIVPLQLDALTAGKTLETVDTWKDGTEPTTYLVQCTGFRRAADGWHVDLLYDRGRGSNKAVARTYPELDWGTTRLHVRDDLSAATAVFEPDDGSATGAGKCTLIKTGLYGSLSRAQVSVLLRPGQAALREELLSKFGRCAISNETTAEALEAAHIVEHSAGGRAAIENAMLLRADIHALFDADKLRIDSAGGIQLIGLPPDSSYLKELAGIWNKSLPQDVLGVVKAALAERNGTKGRRTDS